MRTLAALAAGLLLASLLAGCESKGDDATRTGPVFLGSTKSSGAQGNNSTGDGNDTPIRPSDARSGPFVLKYAATGNDPASKTFTVEKNTTALTIKFFVNSTDTGPYAAIGYDANGASLNITRPGAAAADAVFFATPYGAADAPNKPVVSGTRSKTYSNPVAEGTWTLSLCCTGQNIRVEVHVQADYG